MQHERANSAGCSQVGRIAVGMAATWATPGAARLLGTVPRAISTASYTWTGAPGQLELLDKHLTEVALDDGDGFPFLRFSTANCHFCFPADSIQGKPITHGNIIRYCTAPS